ncbi:MAG: NAD(P)-dependent oxidoreductase [Abitibacteriaceae bacterium]|nr:NAD(P)-dependent oxidoreductase [Abditibacteriaceae bacterium]
MKVLITGAGGNLGRALVPLLIEQGHTPRLMDSRPVDLDLPGEFILGDVRNPQDMQRAVEGVDAIVHAAALHGIHVGKWTPQDFWAINVTGTFNVFEAAREHGIKRLVLCSTMGVYGQSATPPPDAWGVVTEDLPLLPGDVYGLSKRLCEEMGQYYSRRWGVTTVALRLGMFVPEGSLERYGFRLLFGGVDDRDVAQAVLRSLTYQPEGGFDAFNIMAAVPFTATDAPALQQDTAGVLARYYPGVLELAAQHYLDLSKLIWGRTIWSVAKAQRLLGYNPHYNFGGFLRALASGDTTYYPFVGLPWWGV